MNKSKQIKSKLDQVAEILARQPETRDNDRELIVAFWMTEQPLIFKFGTADQFTRAFVNKTISMPDDITRSRRKAQEIYPTLRGKLWKDHKEIQDEVTANINKVEL